MSAQFEQMYTDKEFCELVKIDRSTSARWREQGIVAYVKLPNGQIRYLQSQLDAMVGKHAHDKKEAN